MALARRYDLVYFTATILEWKHLLVKEQYRDIVMGSLAFLVHDKRIQLNAFVVMNNHIHLIWQILHPHEPDRVQRSFLRFTAQNIIMDLRNNDRELLQDYYVGASDRKHQIWERNPLSIDIWSEAVLKQKLDYIHNNPVKAGYCLTPEEYRYSSAAIYMGLASEWTDLVVPCIF